MGLRERRTDDIECLRLGRETGESLDAALLDRQLRIALEELFERRCRRHNGRDEAQRLRELGTRVEEKFLSGSGFDELVTAATKVKARLVVLGGLHGRTWPYVQARVENELGRHCLPASRSLVRVCRLA